MQKKNRLFKKIFIAMTIALLLFLILTILIPFISFTSTSSVLSGNSTRVKIIGHRGAAGLAPENTLSSFKKAIELGVDMVELDVHTSKDDSIIVMHDYQVDRTTNGKGEIENLSYDFIKSLDAGSWFNESFKNERVPTLDEVFTLVNGRAKVLVELKWPKKGVYKNLVRLVIESIKRHHAESWVILQSFETEYLKEINKLAPDPKIECQQLVFGKSQLLPIYFDRRFHFGNFKHENNITSINIFYLYLNKSFIKEMHDKNISVSAFTPDKENDFIKAVNLGADAIITNHPELAIKTLRNN